MKTYKFEVLGGWLIQKVKAYDLKLKYIIEN